LGMVTGKTLGNRRSRLAFACRHASAKRKRRLQNIKKAAEELVLWMRSLSSDAGISHPHESLRSSWGLARS